MKVSQGMYAIPYASEYQQLRGDLLSAKPVAKIYAEEMKKFQESEDPLFQPVAVTQISDQFDPRSIAVADYVSNGFALSAVTDREEAVKKTYSRIVAGSKQLREKTQQGYRPGLLQRDCNTVAASLVKAQRDLEQAYGQVIAESDQVAENIRTMEKASADNVHLMNSMSGSSITGPVIDKTSHTISP